MLVWGEGGAKLQNIQQKTKASFICLQATKPKFGHLENHC